MKKKLQTTKVFYFQNFKDIGNNTYSFLYNFLPRERQEKADRCAFEIDKKISIIEYFVVKKALDLKGTPSFCYGKKGKPYIRGHGYFNISHSEDALVVVVSNKNVGIDIQKKISYDEKLAKYICSKKEFKEINLSKNKDLAITKLWVKKESLIKLKAISIATNLKTLLRNEYKYEFTFDKKDDYMICICQKKNSL